VKVDISTLISAEIDFRIRGITRNKKECCIMTKGSIFQEDIAIPNLYAHNNVSSNVSKLTTKRRNSRIYNHSKRLTYLFQ
jgi:hypothetical protein